MVENNFVFRTSKFFRSISIEILIFRSILIDFLKLGRFLTKPCIWGFSGALNQMAVLVFRENRYLWSNRSIRQCRTDRFWSTFRILVDFWPNLGYGGFRGRWIEWRYWFFGKIDICRRIDRFDSAELIASGRFFESLSIFDQTSDMGVFGGAESQGAILFFFNRQLQST